MRSMVKGGELGGVTNLDVIAPVKAGFIDSFATMTYVDRLQRLLDALNESRQNLHEATLFEAPFQDSVARFGIIHSFRYVLIAPGASTDPLAAPGPYWLSLNVTFDGGWEPYMRVIYRDIGFLLDALFCHCEGYPDSTKYDYDTYCRWVRANEQAAGLFYDDSPTTLTDQTYLSEVERIQREEPDAVVAGQKIAACAVPTDAARTRALRAAALNAPLPAVAVSMRSLAGLYRLAPLFSSAAEQQILLSFAQKVLQDFIAILPTLKAIPALQPAIDAAADQFGWLAGVPAAPPSPPPTGTFDASRLQPGIVGTDPDTTHGAMVLMRVADADKAVAWVQTQPAGGDEIRRSLGFTYGGLLALGIPAARLDVLQQEFMDGMEARAGILGDVRGNHPDYWPSQARCDERLQSDPLDRIDLTTVHLALVMRLTDSANNADPTADLHPTLATALLSITPAATGLQVIAVQPTRSWRDKGRTREHFGFIDGISQPGLANVKPLPLPRDLVQPGDIVLGHADSRGDRATTPADPLLFDGSFLVVRKLRQHVDRLDAALARVAAADRPEALAKMMGRTPEGDPLAVGGGGPEKNDFSYDADAEGRGCPFHAHVRRVNQRITPAPGEAPLPRLMRRGMSYGTRGNDAATNRGIVFMAYCASIAEQFETVQRWIAGGNSSGVGSAMADPFLAVPVPGDKRTFRYLDATGQVARIDLGDQPFATLEWGLYLFVPSLAALKDMGGLRTPVAEAAAAPFAAPPTPDRYAHWRSVLEDTDPVRSPTAAAWAAVRAKPDARLDACPYGHLRGRQADVLEVLQNADQAYSVQGYGRRMADSIGLNYLGMDRDGGHAVQAPPVNAAIEKIGEQAAFDAALPLVRAVLARFLVLKQPLPDGRIRLPVDLMTLAENVLGGLCSKWLGLPEAPGTADPFMVVGGRVEGDPAPPRCPGNLLSASPFVFVTHPSPEVVESGRIQGRSALKAVTDWLASGRPLGPLAVDIKDGLAKAPGVDAPERDAVVARSIVGVMLGFPPTVYGNYLRVMETWIDERTLWDCQRRFVDAPGSDVYPRARDALRPPLMATMRRRPVPDMLWRCPVEHGQVVGAEDGKDDARRIVLGIASALTDPAVPDEMMFGGSRKPTSPVATEHACPGYGMGVGVLLALMAGLFEAGTLRPTGSPVLMMLTPREDWINRANASAMPAPAQGASA